MASAASPRVLSLAEALRQAEREHPSARMARAQQEIMRSRTTQTLAPLLPQISGIAEYQRTTANYVQRPGALPANYSVVTTQSDSRSYNYWVFQATASQLVWDFGATLGAYQAAQATLRAQDQNLVATQQGLAYNVRTAYFAAQAAQALVAVGQENVANIARHLEQIERELAVGMRAHIDLVSARKDVANAQVTLINYENALANGKLALNQAVGVENDLAYSLVDEPFVPVEGEEFADGRLVDEAVANRPEFAQFEAQLRAQTSKIVAARGGLFPSLSLQASVTDSGSRIKHLAYNWSTQAVLNWNLFNGALSFGQLAEARATLLSLQAGRDAFRQQVHVAVENARLAIKAGQQVLSAAEDSLLNARAQLAYADGRYDTGTGSIIELADAQLAYATAAAQRVQAHFQLATARAQLLYALGRTVESPA